MLHFSIGLASVNRLIYLETMPFFAASARAKEAKKIIQYLLIWLSLREGRRFQTYVSHTR